MTDRQWPRPIITTDYLTQTTRIRWAGLLVWIAEYAVLVWLAAYGLGAMLHPPAEPMRPMLHYDAMEGP